MNYCIFNNQREKSAQVILLKPELQFVKLLQLVYFNAISKFDFILSMVSGTRILSMLLNKVGKKKVTVSDAITRLIARIIDRILAAIFSWAARHRQ